MKSATFFLFNFYRMTQWFKTVFKKTAVYTVGSQVRTCVICHYGD